VQREYFKAITESRIVIPDDYPPVISGTPPLSLLKDLAEVTVYAIKADTEDELIDRLSEAVGVLNIRSYSKFTAKVIAALPSLKLISVWGTGTDHLDLEACLQRGVAVATTADTATDAVAEHSLALMMALARSIPSLDNEVKKGGWPRSIPTQLCGKRLGIIGTGAIGRRMARLGRGIGMDVVAWSFNPSQETADECGFIYIDLKELLKSSDVVSMHARLSPETADLIGAEQFDLMKRSALLINTARGPIVNKEALYEALKEGKIAGAGLDVFHSEPVDPDDPLLSLDNVVLSPHNAGQTPEALERSLDQAVENIINFFKGIPDNLLVHPKL
jgi:D-3-phosphoglycerate dehydrogenase